MRNVPFLGVGAPIVALGDKVCDDHKEPKGGELDIRPGGIPVEKK